MDKATHNGNTPFMKAASVGALGAAKVLLNEGANMNHQGTGTSQELLVPLRYLVSATYTICLPFMDPFQITTTTPMM